ncbi:ubiquinone/menaquinone biosynthesis methyltransferase [Actinocrinis puniceicyclus]|uniref:Demethylmenaquinone methyltransferase n=1 Tax=Actinocrinis puniceicyclus TaxID=977794 RepID=A0A8J7WRT1_9ACTN|nr:ubiquinone/menaquinone biosynthesis methyltransferase [Actinocrinis puniceicyclus]MBS2964395.1 ubiquinone/menaquinone biosynthesis methyltransferase [Actinocrinis puniceicyclus]
MTSTMADGDTLTFEQFLAMTSTQQATVVRRGVPTSAEVGLIRQLRIIIMLGRPRTCVPGLIAYFLGYSYTDAGFSPKLLLGALLGFLIGFSANLHNTYTDLEEDCRNLPGRVWLYAQLGAPRMRLVLIGVNAFMLLSSLAFSTTFFVYMALAVIGLHQYSFPPLRMKARPVLGLYVFAQAVVFPFISGWLSDTTMPPFTRDHAFVAMLVYLTLWFLAKGTFKNVPDYEGDRAAGLRTSATVFPTRLSAARFAAAATMVAYLAVVALVAGGWSPPRMLLCLPWCAVALVQCARLVRAQDAGAANAVLRTDMVVSSGFVASVLLLQAPTWRSVAVIAAGGLVLIASDLLMIDSRRDSDAATGQPGASGVAAARPRTPQTLFDRVAPRYDALNRLLSLGRDRYWRRSAARLVQVPPGGTVLDVATGTGALAIEIAKRLPQGARVVGCDLNATMLQVAGQRVRRDQSLAITLTRGDAMRLPLADACVDAATISFAIDDMPDRHACAAELSRVLRPGGRLVLLELSMPDREPLRSVYLGALGALRLAGRLRGGEGYRHLREEIVHYRGREAVERLLRGQGFEQYQWRRLTGGIATLHLAYKPLESPNGPRPAPEGGSAAARTANSTESGES